MDEPCVDSRVQYETVNILGVDVHCINFAEMLVQISKWIDEARSTDPFHTPHTALPTPHPPLLTHQICTVNPEFIMTAHHNRDFANMLQRADLCVPDGVGVLWAAKQVGVELSERVTGSDGVYRISKSAAQEGWRVFLLGAAPGIAEQAAAKLRERYPHLLIAGTYSGSPHDDDWPAIQPRLAAADILLVAFGHPRQDFWIDRHKAEISAPVAIGVGGAFDFVAGVTTRAPLWMQRLGLEWLHRLLRQPWRARRMLALPCFVALVWWSALRHKFR